MSKVKKLALCGLFAATTAVLSQIAIPIQPVPVNLALLSVFIAGALLGGVYGAISQAVYVFVGAVGLPVFSGFRGGFTALVSPTGGYIIGYIAAAFVVGCVCSCFKYRMLAVVLGIVAGLVCCYALGTAWFLILTKMDFWKALMLTVIPFLPGDAVKIGLAALVAVKLKRYSIPLSRSVERVSA